MLTGVSLLVLISGLIPAESPSAEQSEKLDHALIRDQRSTDVDHRSRRENLIYEALPVVLKKKSEIVHDVRLPDKAIEIDGKLVYPDLKDENETIEYLCPAEDPFQRRHLVENQRELPKVEYCLLDHLSGPNQSKCKYEASPLFTLVEHRERPSPIQCGENSRHKLFTFGFMYCTVRDESAFKLPKVTSSLLSLYEVCFDTYHLKTLFTKHDVRTGAMLERPGLPSQRTEFPVVLSTQSFHLPDEYVFWNKQQEYGKQDPNTRYKMTPQMLVPENDFAINLWKKTTHHYLNTEPIWDKLVPLMNAINDGIRKAAVTVDLRNEKKAKGDLSYHTLDIFTITFSHLWWPRRIYNNLISFFKQNNDEPFGLNIWCKFVYYPLENEGVMIYLHNLPDNPPERKADTEPKDRNSKDSLIGQECEKPITCNFETWSDQPGSVSNELLKYAYCCEPNENKLKKYFSIILEKNIKFLNIDDILDENKY